jgi:hypothetical protein
MANGDSETGRADGEGGKAAPGAPAGDALQQRVIAFAETLGRMAGTVQARAEGWMDREALRQQITSVRDGAAELLKQLGVTSAAPKPKNPDEGTGASSAASASPSGGVADESGQKHRNRSHGDPEAGPLDGLDAKMRGAKTIEKVTRRRGRG